MRRANPRLEAWRLEIGARAVRPEAVHELFEACVNSGSLEELTRLYERDAALVRRDGTLVSGAPAIKEYFRALLARNARVLIQNTGTIDAGDVAVLLSDWGMGCSGPDGAVVTSQGHSYDVVRRRRDGTWRIVVDNPWGARLISPAAK